MSVTLTTKQITLPMPTQIAQSAPFIKPLSYEFRVAEIVEDGVVTSVKLQVQTFEHDEYGSGVIKQYWQDVPRFKMDKNGNFL